MAAAGALGLGLNLAQLLLGMAKVFPDGLQPGQRLFQPLRRKV
jgi:hypothetical protein